MSNQLSKKELSQLNDCLSTKNKLMYIIYGLITTLIIFMSVIIFLYENKKYFYFRDDGSVFQLSEKKVNLTSDLMYRFTDDSIVRVFTYSYVNINFHFSKIQHYFTSTGWQNFNEAIEKSNTIEYIKRLELSTTVTPTPTIYNYTPNKFNGIDVYRSFAIQEVGLKRNLKEVVYKVSIQQFKDGNYYYNLGIDNIKEMSLSEYYQEFYPNGKKILKD